MNKMNINTDEQMAKAIAQNVDAAGGRTFYVGGYVRDKVLGKVSKDIDIEVHGIKPEQLKEILSGLGELRTQGASFGVYNLRGYDIDIAQPRSEKAIGNGHKDFEVSVDPFIGCEKAAKRRDFTINAIMEDVLTGEMVDPFGGMKDCEDGIIRYVNVNTFKEDPLRVLRAAQFASRFHFSIAPETKEVMKQMDLTVLSQERIYGEMKKALVKSDEPSVFFNILRETNQLRDWFPELQAMIGCEQNPDYHPEGDAWNHTMIVLDKAAKLRKEAKQPEHFMVAALCHDMGKPDATESQNGKIHSYGHEKAGVPVAEAFLKRVNNDKALMKYVTNMVANHMRPHTYYANQCKVSKTNQLFDESISPSDLILLCTADTAGKDMGISKPCAERDFLQARLKIYEDCMKLPQVTGKDLIQIGIAPGPEFREILAAAHHKHLEGNAKDQVLKGITTEQQNKYTKAIQSGEISLSVVPDALKTKKMCMDAVRKRGSALEYIPENLRTEEICLAAVEQDGEALCYIPFTSKTNELCIAAVSQNWEALQYVEPDFETVDVIKAAITNCHPEDRNDLDNLIDNYNVLQETLEQLEQEAAEHSEQEEDTVI